MILLTVRVFVFLALETLTLALAKVHLWFVSLESLKLISVFGHSSNWFPIWQLSGFLLSYSSNNVVCTGKTQM